MVCCNYTEILEFFPNQNKTHLQLFLEQEHLYNCACVFLCYKITFLALYLLLLETFCLKLSWVYGLVLLFREKHWNYGRILEGREMRMLFFAMENTSLVFWEICGQLLETGSIARKPPESGRSRVWTGIPEKRWRWVTLRLTLNFLSSSCTVMKDAALIFYPHWAHWVAAITNHWFYWGPYFKKLNCFRTCHLCFAKSDCKDWQGLHKSAESILVVLKAPILKVSFPNKLLNCVFLMFLGVCREVQTLPPFVELSDGQNSLRLCTAKVKGARWIWDAQAQWLVQNPSHDI